MKSWNKILSTTHYTPFTHKAFTLAEVLITLGIIGVVASITIPTLMQNKFEQETSAKLKKAYSTLSNAYDRAVQETGGTPDAWDLKGADDSQGALNMLNAFAPHLSIIKNCGVSTNQDCFPSGTYKTLAGADNINVNTTNQVSKVELKDGNLLFFKIKDANCALSPARGGSLALQNVCAVAGVDTNGFKSPNQIGIDLFTFYVTKYGIVPYGTQQETQITFNGYCKNKVSADGWACTAWVIYNENLDYLHCNNLSWSGPTKCQ